MVQGHTHTLSKHKLALFKVHSVHVYARIHAKKSTYRSQRKNRTVEAHLLRVQRKMLLPHLHAYFGGTALALDAGSLRCTHKC